MDRTVQLLLNILLLVGVTVGQNRNLQQLTAGLNNTGIFHDRTEGISGSLGRPSAQQSPSLADLHQLSIGGSSSSQGSSQYSSHAPGSPLDRIIGNAVSRINGEQASRRSLLGQNVGRYLQRLDGSRGTAQDTGEQLQSGPFGGRPLDGLVQSALPSFNLSRSGILGQSGNHSAQRFVGSLGTVQNTGVQHQLEFSQPRPLDRFVNSLLPRFNSSRSSNLGQTGNRMQQHNDGSMEASYNVQPITAPEDGPSRFITPVLSRFNAGSSSPPLNYSHHGTSSHSADSSGYSASEDSGDRSATGSGESGSSGGNSS